MLSQTKVVKARKAIESLYDGVCDIIEYQKIVKPNKSTGFSEVPIAEKQSCRISFSNISENSGNEDFSSKVTQIIKLFIAPELNIKPGSKISVTQNGVTTDYKSSGQPAIYSTHQEIILELFKGWS